MWMKSTLNSHFHSYHIAEGRILSTYIQGACRKAALFQDFRWLELALRGLWKRGFVDNTQRNSEPRNYFLVCVHGHISNAGCAGPSSGKSLSATTAQTQPKQQPEQRQLWLLHPRNAFSEFFSPDGMFPCWDSTASPGEPVEQGIEPVSLQDPVLQNCAFPKINFFWLMTTGRFAQKKGTITTRCPWTTETLSFSSCFH